MNLVTLDFRDETSDPVLLETNHSEIVPNRAKDSHRPADRPAGHETSLLGTSE